MKPFRFAVLASGSKGNAAMVAVGEDRFLIDAGISPGQVKKRLRQIGECDTGFRGIFLTHMHRDHTAYAYELAKHLFCRVYCSEKTANVIVHEWTGKDSLDFSFKGLRVQAISVPHCEGSLAYVFTRHRRRLVFAHDLGSVPKMLLRAAKHANVIAIEANYEPGLLRVSNRAEELKARITSSEGHLSNERCKEFLRAADNPKLHTVIALHLSQVTNSPELAESAALSAFIVDNKVTNESVRVIVASQDVPSEVVEV